MQLIGNRGESIKCPKCGYVDPYYEFGCFTQHNFSYACSSCDAVYEPREKGEEGF